MTAYLNGQFVDTDKCVISPLDRGFLFGDSVYEVLPVYGGAIFRCDDHLHRLAYSLNAIAIDNPKSNTQWKAIFSQLIDRCNLSDLSIYLQISRGIAAVRIHCPSDDMGATVFAMTMPPRADSAALVKNGASVITAKDIRWHRCDIKSTNLLASVMLGMQLKADAHYETIMLDQDYVTEGSSSNVFIVRNNCLLTPPLGPKVLAGITRKVVIEIALQQQIECQEKKLTHTDLLHADEIWLTSSTRNIVPVTRIDGQPVGSGTPGKLWHQFSAALIRLSLRHTSVL